MAFLNNLEQKVRINLSRAAADVVEGDMARFGTENRTGFLNTVMKQYFQTAEASIVLTLEREREHWQQYAAFFPDRESMERLMNRLLGERREALLEKAGSYPRGDSFVFRLNNENYAYLTAEDSDCREERAYQKMTAYCKAVLEEYAALPALRREEVFYRERYELIRRSIAQRRQLKVVTRSGTSYAVFPYRIVPDPLSTTQYLVCYTAPPGAGKHAMQPSSLRICFLKEVALRSSGILTKKEQEALERAVEKRGVQFLLTDTVEVVVRFTERGLNSYRHMLHLRPDYDPAASRDGRYVFHCTEAQAAYYFFKLGADVEILAPRSLRESFAARYRDAAALYAGQEVWI